MSNYPIQSALLWLISLCIASVGCEQKQARARLYFDDLRIPLGLTGVEILSDRSLNAETGSSIEVIAKVPSKIDRDDLDRLMKSFYRQSVARRGFVGSGLPGRIDLRFYQDANEARVGGDAWLGRALRAVGGIGGLIRESTNSSTGKVGTKSPGDAAAVLPKSANRPLSANRKRGELTIKLPYVSENGSGAWRQTLKYEQAVREFLGVSQTLFAEVNGLRRLQFVGIYKDHPVLTVSLSKEQFDQLNVVATEERLSAYEAQFINDLAIERVSEKVVQQKTATARREGLSILTCSLARGTSDALQPAGTLTLRR